MSCLSNSKLMLIMVIIISLGFIININGIEISPRLMQNSENPTINHSNHFIEAHATDNVQLTSTGNTYTISQLTDAATRVRTFIQLNNRLPSFVTIAGEQVVMSDFLYLLARATVNLDQGDFSSLEQYQVNGPLGSRDEIRSGNILRGEYVGLAGEVSDYVESTGRAPSSISSSQGHIGIESQVYLFSRIVGFYGAQRRLPFFASISPWTGPKLPETPPADIEILSTATGGDVTRNNIINQYTPRSALNMDIISAARTGTPMLTFGEGDPQVMIVAGLHGNELPPSIAAMRLVNFLEGRDLQGTVHVIPYAIPYSTTINSRNWQGEDPNRVANVEGTPSNIILNTAIDFEVSGLGDFHSTRPGGYPGITSVLCTEIPTSESLNLANYISQETGAELINHEVAGVVYPGALADEGNEAGIPSVICEVQSPHGFANLETINTSYKQMIAFLNYFNIL